MSGFYETNRAVAEYLLFHYGADELVMPWSFGPKDGLHFPSRCVEAVRTTGPLPPGARGLDLGCAVGGASFELARDCAEVIGIDFSRRLIETARQLAEAGAVAYEIVVQGDHREPAVAHVPKGIQRDRVRFETGDALDLRRDLGQFDVVVAANLLDRVPRPRDLLRRLPDLLRPGGRLLLTSPYTWLEEYTAREDWLATADGKTSDVIQELMPDLRRVARRDLAFVIREHARKFQWSVAEATIWLKP